jgi:hypothetical protein
MIALRRQFLLSVACLQFEEICPFLGHHLGRSLSQVHLVSGRLHPREERRCQTVERVAGIDDYDVIQGLLKHPVICRSHDAVFSFNIPRLQIKG